MGSLRLGLTLQPPAPLCIPGGVGGSAPLAPLPTLLGGGHTPPPVPPCTPKVSPSPSPSARAEFCIPRSTPGPFPRRTGRPLPSLPHPRVPPAWAEPPPAINSRYRRPPPSPVPAMNRGGRPPLRRRTLGEPPPLTAASGRLAGAAAARNAEREELAALNDRFAAFLERVRALERQNGALRNALGRAAAAATVPRTAGLVQGELRGLRERLQHLGRDRDRLQAERDGLAADLAALRQRWVGGGVGGCGGGVPPGWGMSVGWRWEDAPG